MLLHSLRIRRRIKNAPRASSVSLPLEIELLIIDQFEGDTSRLRRLCHVCRAWGAHAQALIFREVDVRYRTVGRFLALVNITSVGRHITTLSIIEGSHWLRVYDEPSLLGCIAPLPHRALPNVRTLTISYRRFVPWTEVEIAVRWSSIARLKLHFCKFATTDTMIAFVAAFPRLESLDVFQCSVEDVAAGTKAIEMPAWCLKYLAFGEFPQNALIDWMVAAPADLAVEHLRILSLGPDPSPFNALLAKIGADLRHLEVPGMHRPQIYVEAPLSIRACTALTTLSFSEGSPYDLGRGIISILAQAASPVLATIAFHIHLNTGYLDIPWEEIDALLGTDTFGALQVVVFDMWGGPFEYAVLTPYDTAVRVLQMRLAPLAGRRILRFRYADDKATQTYVPPEVDSPRAPLVKRLSRSVSRWMGADGGRSVELRNRAYF
ncbi:hypothetical protein B0H15DRAFT_831992 [Mycena belliarum]|uniref:F-box domain-containing protein n=1 Tax=Mycena belliarum TaxID=1033014 RepID=A0AAD6UC10_9AGAR|nr:hypothetical protein B0H15DRAFT_831992 [Mycena belliae]